MVQPYLEGGSLHASRTALDYARWLAVPYPTQQERVAGEAKVQVSPMLADGSVAVRMGLLHLKVPGALSRPVVLRTKDDCSCGTSSEVVPLDLSRASQPSMF